MARPQGCLSGDYAPRHCPKTIATSKVSMLTKINIISCETCGRIVTRSRIDGFPSSLADAVTSLSAGRHDWRPALPGHVTRGRRYDSARQQVKLATPPAWLPKRCGISLLQLPLRPKNTRRLRLISTQAINDASELAGEPPGEGRTDDQESVFGRRRRNFRQRHPGQAAFGSGWTGCRDRFGYRLPTGDVIRRMSGIPVLALSQKFRTSMRVPRPYISFHFSEKPLRSGEI